MKKFFLMMLVVFSSMFVMVGCSDDTDALAEAVLESMEETFDKNPLTADIDVESVILVHEGDNNYSGVATLSNDDEVETVAISVVYDGKSFVWKVVE